MRDVSRYRVGGTRVPSVTEVLAISGLVDLSAIPFDTLERARQRGSDVHEWLEGIDLGLIDDEKPDDRIAGYVEAYRRFRVETGFVPDLIEHPVVNEAHRYAGTLDRTGTLNGKRTIVDFKATAAVEAHVGVQLAGYALALREPHERVALQLFPDSHYRMHHFRSREDGHDFLAAVRVTHYRLRHGLAALED